MSQNGTLSDDQILRYAKSPFDKEKMMGKISSLVITMENGRMYEGSFTEEDVKLSYSNEFTIKAKEVACSGLNEEERRNQSSCISLGYAIRVYLETGGEEETFSFEECVDRVPEYKNCKEVVKMPQNVRRKQIPKRMQVLLWRESIFEEKSYPEK